MLYLEGFDDGRTDVDIFTDIGTRQFVPPLKDKFVLEVKTGDREKTLAEFADDYERAAVICPGVAWRLDLSTILPAQPYASRVFRTVVADLNMGIIATPLAGQENYAFLFPIDTEARYTILDPRQFSFLGNLTRETGLLKIESGEFDDLGSFAPNIFR